MKKLFFIFITFFAAGSIFAMENAENPFHFNHFMLDSDSEISAADLNNPITDADRISVSEDGHLECGGKRIRIFGTNLTSFPTSHKQAEFAARALANQGYNCIRFHHTDASWSNCFIKTTESGKHIVDTKRLNDFDYFFYQLKLNGIYSNINLLTGRPMSPQDGYPDEMKGMPWKSAHCYGFWNEEALQLQKEWASFLLTHVNPYTGIAYKDDPAVAIVEVNNENGFIMGYLNKMLDDYSENLWQELEDQWNEYLKKEGQSYAALSSKYNVVQKEITPLITDDYKWNLEQHNGAQAQVTKNGTVTSIKITNNGSESWHIQYGASKLNIKSENVYTLRFRAKASAACDISVHINQAHDPWKSAGFSKNLSLTTKWQDFEFTTSGLMTDSNLRVIFSTMGFLSGKTIYLDNVTFCEGGSIEYVKKGRNNGVNFPRYADFQALPLEYKNLVLNFLWEKEKAYWTAMRDYVKQDLNCNAMMMGTAMGCSTTYLQSCFDIIDSHAYWNHPAFPVSDWNMNYFYVNNKDLVSNNGNITLTNLAKYRVYGKPFSVSEYDHPYPNQYSSEMYPMLSTYACFQDWDCLFTFCSELPKNSDGQNQKINGYFDQTNNPCKSCAAPLAARIFRKFLVNPGKTAVYIPLDEKTERSQLYKNQAWSVGNTENYGFDSNLGFCYRVGIAMDNKVPENGKIYTSVEAAVPSETGSFTDTKEIYWDQKSGVYLVCNDSVTISIYHSPDSVIPEFPAEWNKAGRVLPLKDVKDFACMAAVKDDSKYLIFGCSWTGNKGENLRLYGSSGDKSDFKICREPIKLTTDGTLGKGPAYALSTSGTFEIAGGVKRTLYKCGLSGNRVDSGKKAARFTMNSSSGTLWYVLE